MVEQVCFMVSKAKSSASATITPSSIEAFLLMELGAKLLDVFTVKGETYYAFGYRDMERVATGYEALRRSAERARENQAVAAQRAELTRRLQAAVAEVIRKTR